MSLDSVKSKIESKIASAPEVDAVIMFDFGDDGQLTVDGTKTPAEVTEGEHDDPDTTLVCSLETFQNILEGKQDPNIAFMMGKLKVKGSMGLAMKLNGILED
jgi:putative sterol carrier protein